MRKIEMGLMQAPALFAALLIGCGDKITTDDAVGDTAEMDADGADPADGAVDGGLDSDIDGGPDADGSDADGGPVDTGSDTGAGVDSDGGDSDGGD